MSALTEIEQLEVLVGDESVPFGNRLAASGRLMELYLELPDADRYAVKAEGIASMGASWSRILRYIQSSGILRRWPCACRRL
jgi:hypothetical protein